jgi:hypothetical protein
MVLLNQQFKAFALDMGIDLGSGDIGVAQHLLKAAQIGAVIEKMGSEGMPDYMG